MVAENWKPGKRSKQYAENYEKVSFEHPPTPAFSVMFCTRCNIKVTTSNGKCPCCGTSDSLRSV